MVTVTEAVIEPEEDGGRGPEGEAIAEEDGGAGGCYAGWRRT